MSWFKILLLVLFGMGTLHEIVKSGGWRSETKNWEHAVNAVINTLLFVGIWLWL